MFFIATFLTSLNCTLADHVSNVDNIDTTEDRTKRNPADSSAKLLAKLGKYAPSWLRTIQAKKTLLKDAELMEINVKRSITTYMKKGSIRKALEDFELLDPSNVKIVQYSTGYGKFGTLGSYRILLEWRDKPIGGSHLQPECSIWMDHVGNSLDKRKSYAIKVKYELI